MGNKKGLDRIDPKRGTLCTARRRNGEKCLNYAMSFSTVCRLHGGAAPQVKAAAQVRMLMAADKAAAELIGMMLDKSAPHSVRLAAARDLLDRAGLGARAGVDVEVAVSGGMTLLERNLADVIVEYGEDVVDGEVVESDPPAAPERPALRPKRKRSYRSGDGGAP